MRDAAERLIWTASAERKMAEDDNLPAIVDAVCCSRLMRCYRSTRYLLLRRRMPPCGHAWRCDGKDLERFRCRVSPLDTGLVEVRRTGELFFFIESVWPSSAVMLGAFFFSGSVWPSSAVSADSGRVGDGQTNSIAWPSSEASK